MEVKLKIKPDFKCKLVSHHIQLWMTCARCLRDIFNHKSFIRLEWLHTGFTRVECSKMAIRRSWMRRISSSPVLRCSFFSRRMQEARSVHCSRVSSEENTGSQSSLSPLLHHLRWTLPSRICRVFVCRSRASVCCSITSIFSVSWL